jgi:hypothetical protein
MKVEEGPFATSVIANVFLILLAITSILALLILSVYLVFVKFAWQFLYYYVWIIIIGLPLLLLIKNIRNWASSFPAPKWLKYFSLAYSMVMMEEVFAALFNHLSEGINIFLLFQRITQFWAFNLIAFTGLILSTWILYNKFNYSFSEAFILVGIIGLISEKIFFLLPGELLHFLIFAPITMMTYGIILTPALLSIGATTRPKLPIIIRAVIFIVIWFLFSIIPIQILIALRNAFPVLFPPCQFISCT